METTDLDFELFRDEALYWIDYFGLKDWEVDIVHVELDGVMANCTGMWKSKHATLRLNTEWEDRYCTALEFRKSAFHEVCELLLMEVHIIAASRYCEEPDLDHAMHGVIQRLVNTIFTEKPEVYHPQFSTGDRIIPRFDGNEIVSTGNHAQIY